MAWGTKYRIEFKDILGLDWKILIQEEPDPGSIIDLVATGDPLHFDLLSDSDEFNDPIRPSKAIFNVWSTTDFMLTSLYSDEDFKYKVIIYKGAAGTDVYWTGFIVTGEYSEPYDCTPYPVQITAVDGLNYLKNILYDDAGTYYNGRELESKIIMDILTKIQITGFTEYVNLYEVEMDITSDDSPMDQLKIDVDIFQDMNCYEVLFHILKKYNAVIRQVEGQIVIYRPTELSQAVVYGRVFIKNNLVTDPDEDFNNYDTMSLSGTTILSAINVAGNAIVRSNKFSVADGDIIPVSFYLTKTSGQFPTISIHEAGVGAVSNEVVLVAGINSVILTVSGYTGVNAVFAIYNTAASEFNTSPIYVFDEIAKSSTNFIPAQQISRAAGGMVGGVTNLKQFPGSIIMVKSPAKKITLTQDYGWKESWIDNWQFPSKTFTLGTTPIENWTSVGAGISYAQIGRFIPGEKSGVSLTINGAPVAAPDTGSYLKQIFGTHSLVTTDAFAIEFSFLLLNTTGADIAGAVIYIELKNNGGTKFLYEKADGNCDWDNAQKYITITLDSPIGSTGWIDYKRTILGIPTSSTYQISLFAIQEDICLAIKDLKFYASSDEIATMSEMTPGVIFLDSDREEIQPGFIKTYSIKNIATIVKKEYVITNAINGKNIVSSYILGDVADSAIDNVTEQFMGSLATWVSGFFANALVWNTYTGTGGGRTSGGENDPLLEIIGGEMGNQYSRPKQLVQMNIKETDTTDTVLNLIGNFQDSLNQIGGNNRKFIFNAGELDVKNRLWNVDLLEII